MTHIIKLNADLYNSSQRFVGNFLSYTNKRSIELSIPHSNKTIQKFLDQEPVAVKLEWDRVVGGGRSYWLEFDSQEDYIMFVLRWS